MKKVVLSVTLAGSLFILPSISEAALGDQTLREGMRHNDVVELQEVLRDKGHFTFHTSTGFFGEITRSAVRDFQRSAGIQVDGIVGPQTFGALEVSGTSSNGSSSSSSSSTASNSSSSVTFETTLRNGMRGSHVRALQDALRDRGFSAGSSGIYGPKTIAGVRDFQRAAGIGVDGIAGPQTFGALNNGVSRESNETNISSSSSSSSSSDSSSSTNLASGLESTAKDLIGTPYSWGGTSPSGFDCSGFLGYVFSQNGVDIPRTVSGIHSASSSVSSPQKGDLVFFETYTSGPSHAGIYLGNGDFIHAGTSTGVTISNLSQSYWNQRYLGAGRIN
ncbi:peptidoglycan-binding protein [Bacillus shivajii]|uniref:C40 family peptidase n=1 Tax=Bacillus shivajii TaxID=1983719 RepID=UPI001CFA144F|nr:peptidoglycan-binding protein [Bacillus shivajii]UCZ52965.1 peptidoglycan-binding protein [Bacillus shivajii]